MFDIHIIIVVLLLACPECLNTTKHGVLGSVLEIYNLVQATMQWCCYRKQVYNIIRKGGGALLLTFTFMYIIRMTTGITVGNTLKKNETTRKLGEL